MNEGLIPARYAKAFYKFAKEKNIEEKVYHAMRSLTEVFESADGQTFRQTISNPYVEEEQKRRLVMTAAGLDKDTSGAAEAINDLLTLLFRNNRIAEFRGIVYAYDNIYRNDKNIRRVKVTWASEPQQASEQRLKKMISDRLGGGSMEYSSSVDPQLIGGFKVAIDNEQLDASVSNELRQLRQQILSK